jgi:hypothetical protein
MPLVTTMSAVSVMHKEVHQRARQKEEKGQRSEQVCRVLGHKIEARNGQKSEQHDAATGAP